MTQPDAAMLLASLGDPSAWADGGSPAPLAEIPERELAAILLSLEDRAEELYERANGRRAPSCMLATAWLYGTPFCRAAVAEVARRGLDLVSLKHEARSRA